VGEGLGFSELRRLDPPAPLLPFNMRIATEAHNQELVGAPDQGAGSSGPETESLAVGRPLGSIQQNVRGQENYVRWHELACHVAVNLCSAGAIGRLALNDVWSTKARQLRGHSWRRPCARKTIICSNYVSFDSLDFLSSFSFWQFRLCRDQKVGADSKKTVKL
jgi:hypothetical protein